MKIIITIFTILISTTANSLTYGSFTCGEILMWERENNPEQIGFVKLFMAGYIYGKNEQKYTNYFDDTDHETIFYLDVNECNKDPQLTIEGAAYKIWIKEVAK